MIFIPCSDENKIISLIHEYHHEEYVLIRMTRTMIEKNNLDANGLLRQLLHSWNLVDYEHMNYGGQHGTTCQAMFIQRDKTTNVKLKFYRVANKRGDRRFSIETLKKKQKTGEINEGDLLYISVFKKDDGIPQIYFINLTNNTPTEQKIINVIGIDAIAQTFEKIRPKIQEIVHGGFYNNAKGKGEIDPKDVGDTLEALLGINTNNRDNADYNGLIEIKSKNSSNTKDTLFTLRPQFEGTRTAEYEKEDKHRVQAFTRIYGYDSDKHPGCNSLYITIGPSDSPKNNQNFYLFVNDEKEVVNIIWQDPITQKEEIAAYLTFDSLKKALYSKHPSTLWVKAESRKKEDMVQFRYTEIEFSRAPQFATFLSLIKSGDIVYDWRGYTTKTGEYGGKNHGNALRIKPDARKELFDTIEKVIF